MLKTSDRLSMSLEQAVGLAGANANAVSPRTASFEVAQYLLSKKHLLNSSFEELCRRVERIVEWQKIYEIGLRLKVDLEQLEIIESPRDPHTMIVSVSEDDFSMIFLFNFFAGTFRVEVGGSPLWHWQREREEIGQPVDATVFLRDEVHSNAEHYVLGPQCVWVSDRVEYSPPVEGRRSGIIRQQDVEMSRCITLREYLIYILAHRVRWIRAHHSLEDWTPPFKNSRIWCLGSTGKVIRLRAEHDSEPFSPLVYWVGPVLHIEFTPHWGDVEGGTLYVVRPPC